MLNDPERLPEPYASSYNLVARGLYGIRSMVQKRKKSIYECRYRIRIIRHDDGYVACVYCGNPADSIDHVPPISRVSDYEALGLKQSRYLKLSSCRECNFLLGNSLQATFLERIDSLKFRLTKKHRKVLNAHEFSDDELDDFGPSLGGYIRSSVSKKCNILDRLEFRLSVDELIAIFED